MQRFRPWVFLAALWWHDEYLSGLKNTSSVGIAPRNIDIKDWKRTAVLHDRHAYATSHTNCTIINEVVTLGRGEIRPGDHRRGLSATLSLYGFLGITHCKLVRAFPLDCRLGSKSDLLKMVPAHAPSGHGRET